MEPKQNQELSQDVPTSTENNEVNSEVQTKTTEKQETPKTFKDSIREKLTTEENGEQKAQVKPTKQEAPKIRFEDIGSVSPADMSKEEKERFAKLSPEDQSYIARISKQYRSDYGRQTQAVKDMQAKIKPVYELLTAEEQNLAKMGLLPDQVVREAIAWKKSMITDKKAAAKEFFKTYGIDPIDLIDDEVSEPQQQQQQVFDPVAYEQQITQKVLQSIQEQNLENQRQVALQTSEDVVNKFIRSKPLFSDPIIGERLEMEMAGIVEGSLKSQPNQKVEDVLEKAFNFVVNSNPEFSGILQKYNAKTEATKLQSEADKARSASRFISGGASTPVPNSNRGVPFKQAFARNLGTSYD
jgi:hypothetical protein